MGKKRNTLEWDAHLVQDSLLNKQLLLHISEVLPLPYLFKVTQDSICVPIQNELINPIALNLSNQKYFLWSTGNAELILKAARSSLSLNRKLIIVQ